VGGGWCERREHNSLAQWACRPAGLPTGAQLGCAALGPEASMDRASKESAPSKHPLLLLTAVPSLLMQPFLSFQAPPKQTHLELPRVGSAQRRDDVRTHACAHNIGCTASSQQQPAPARHLSWAVPAARLAAQASHLAKPSTMVAHVNQVSRQHTPLAEYTLIGRTAPQLPRTRAKYLISNFIFINTDINPTRTKDMNGPRPHTHACRSCCCARRWPGPAGPWTGSVRPGPGSSPPPCAGPHAPRGPPPAPPRHVWL